MTFKVLNKNSILLVTNEGTYDNKAYIDGIILSRKEVDYLIRELGHVLDAIKRAKNTHDRIPVCTYMPPSIITNETDIAMEICEFKNFTKYELQTLVDSVPELARWI